MKRSALSCNLALEAGGDKLHRSTASPLSKCRKPLVGSSPLSTPPYGSASFLNYFIFGKSQAYQALNYTEPPAVHSNTASSPKMKTGASRVTRRRKVILLLVGTRIPPRKGNVFTLKNTLIRAERVEESSGGVRVWAECFWDKGSNLAVTSQSSIRRDRGGAAATKRAESASHLPTWLFFPSLPHPALLKFTELIKYLVQVFYLFVYLLIYRNLCKGSAWV